jgi:ADP-ribose pyrophosphatase YjhB (NUDIX family)
LASIRPTGLDVRPVGNPVVDSEVVRSGNEQAHALRLIYSCEVTGGQLRDEASGSTDRAQWFTLSETDPLPLVPLARLGLRLASR